MSKVNITPLYDKVLVKRLADTETTKGGIIIPDVAKEKPVEGKVIAIGHGRILENGGITPLFLAVGDRILFGKYSGQDINVDLEDYTILREEEVLAVLK